MSFRINLSTNNATQTQVQNLEQQIEIKNNEIQTLQQQINTTNTGIQNLQQQITTIVDTQIQENIKFIYELTDIWDGSTSISPVYRPDWYGLTHTPLGWNGNSTHVWAKLFGESDIHDGQGRFVIPSSGLWQIQLTFFLLIIDSPTGVYASLCKDGTALLTEFATTNPEIIPYNRTMSLSYTGNFILNDKLHFQIFSDGNFSATHTLPGLPSIPTSNFTLIQLQPSNVDVI